MPVLSQLPGFFPVLKQRLAGYDGAVDRGIHLRRTFATTPIWSSAGTSLGGAEPTANCMDGTSMLRELMFRMDARRAEHRTRAARRRCDYRLYGTSERGSARLLSFSQPNSSMLSASRIQQRHRN